MIFPYEKVTVPKQDHFQQKNLLKEITFLTIGKKSHNQNIFLEL